MGLPSDYRQMICGINTRIGYSAEDFEILHNGVPRTFRGSGRQGFRGLCPGYCLRYGSQQHHRRRTVEESPLISPPVDSTDRVWGYMDFSKFISLLSKQQLYFCNLELLAKDDPHEDCFQFQITVIVNGQKAAIVQFNVMLADLMTFRHTSDSRPICSANSSGLPPIGTMPIFISRSCTSGFASAAFISRDSTSMTV